MNETVITKESAASLQLGELRVLLESVESRQRALSEAVSVLRQELERRQLNCQSGFKPSETKEVGDGNGT